MNVFFFGHVRETQARRCCRSKISIGEGISDTHFQFSDHSSVRKALCYIWIAMNCIAVMQIFTI
jgi:hypothetical protein